MRTTFPPASGGTRTRRWDQSPACTPSTEDGPPCDSPAARACSPARWSWLLPRAPPRHLRRRRRRPPPRSSSRSSSCAPRWTASARSSSRARSPTSRPRPSWPASPSSSSPPGPTARPCWRRPTRHAARCTGLARAAYKGGVPPVVTALLTGDPGALSDLAYVQRSVNRLGATPHRRHPRPGRAAGRGHRGAGALGRAAPRGAGPAAGDRGAAPGAGRRAPPS